VLTPIFRQGRVGKVLAGAKDGGAAVPTELTLDTTLGSSGARGAVAADDIAKALPEGGRSKDAMTDYMRRRFTEYAAPRGEFSADRGTDFLRKNAELLDRFPELKAEIKESVEAGRFARSARDVADAGLKDARQSIGADFVKAKPGKEFAAILDQRDTRTAARKLAMHAAKDPTGKASLGLKAAALDHLIKEATAGDFLDGAVLRRAMGDKRTGPAIREILSPDEIKRLGRISGELEKMATSRKVRAAEDILNDPVNSALEFIGTTIAARQGAKMGEGASGASLKTASAASSRFKKIMKFLTNDKAKELLAEAVQDRELFKALLTPLDTPARIDKVNRALGPFMGAFAGTITEEAQGREPLPAPPPGGPTENFRGDIVPMSFTPAHDRVNLRDVAPAARKKLADVQSRFGRRLVITSGMRTKEYNAKLEGAAPKSRHVPEFGGDAYDISIKGMDRKDQQRLIRDLSAAGFGGIGIYKGHIHADLGKPRTWGETPKWASAVMRGHLDGRFSK
jgi:hypothetical protein